MTDSQSYGPPFILVRFEQARGLRGVPKAWVPWFDSMNIRTLVEFAYGQMVALCRDPKNHSTNLMPGALDDYSLHNVDGGVISRLDEIRWTSVAPSGQGVGPVIRRAELILTWRNPASLLVEERREVAAQ